MKAKDLQKKITKKLSKVLAKKKPKIRIASDVPPASPFGVSWMDSWVATWIVADKLATAKTQDKEFAAVLQSLVDAKFKQRIVELRRFVKDFPNFSPPDGGLGPGGAPNPPPGPAVFEPPDAGPPEPGVPPVGPAGVFEPPDGGPPEPGVPDPPDPGPTGPDGGLMRDNPWILLWFVSVRAPFIIDMIDAHFTRRLNDMRGR